MKIQSINSINYNLKSLPKKTSKNPSFNGLFSEKQKKNPNVEGLAKHELSCISKKENEFYREFLNRKGKVSYEDYQNIVKNHPSVIAKAHASIYYKIFIKRNDILPVSSPEIFAKNAIILKEILDKKFDDYRIISIGTSPALIAEIMSNLGSEVVYLPISSLKDIKPVEALYMAEEPSSNIRKALLYVDRKIGKNANDKTNVLLDYCCSGNTVNDIKALFIKFNNVDEKKISICSLASAIEENYVSDNAKKDTVVNRLALEAFFRDISSQSVANVSNVPHFEINDLYNQERGDAISSKDKTDEELFQEFDEYSKPNARIYSLLGIHSAQKLKDKGLINKL